jgi:hypothetical protein
MNYLWASMRENLVEGHAAHLFNAGMTLSLFSYLNLDHIPCGGKQWCTNSQHFTKRRFDEATME